MVCVHAAGGTGGRAEQRQAMQRLVSPQRAFCRAVPGCFWGMRLGPCLPDGSVDLHGMGPCRPVLHSPPSLSISL